MQRTIALTSKRVTGEAGNSKSGVVNDTRGCHDTPQAIAKAPQWIGEWISGVQ